MGIPRMQALVYPDLLKNKESIATTLVKSYSLKDVAPHIDIMSVDDKDK